MRQGKDIINRYNTYLRLEKSLSANSIDAYLTDLDKLLRFAEDEKKDVKEISYDDLQQFIAQLRDIGIHPRSQARIISGIKSFYRFLLLDNYITNDPTELLESPKIGLKLPEVLTVNEINSILDTIDLTLPEGQRNLAMLEVLYSCGLRVSELTGLRYSDIYPKEGFIRVEGKGSKQRLVPISEVALREIKNYLYDRNSVVVKKGFEDILFLSRRGTALSRIMVFHIIKQQTEAAGIHKNVSPHTFRHSFATCWKAAPTYALSKRCWGMRKSPPPRYIHISTGNSFAKRYWNIIRGAGQELKRTDPAPLAKPQGYHKLFISSSDKPV